MKPSDEKRRPEGFPGQRLVVIPPEIVRRALARPVTRDLCVTHIGAFRAAESHYVERQRGAPQHVMICCVSGRGICELKGREWRVESGELLFLPPGKRHVYRADPDHPWTIFWFHLRGLRIADHLENLGITEDEPKLRVDAPTALIEAFEDTFRHATHGFGEAAMTGMCTAFTRLIGLARVHRQAPGPRSRGGEDRLLKALAKMREHLEHPWSLEELAGIAGLSAPHFADLCRKHTGMPPLGLLIRLRLQKAMELLQRGTHNVAEAGQEVGYGDPFYFSRLFRKHMGMPPSACRNGP